MKFSTQQLSSGKWGIYSDARLLAMVTSQETCEVILSNLSNGRKEVPEGDSSALYQMPQRTPRQNTRAGSRGSHRRLVRPSNPKVLKAQRLDASVEAQKRHVVASDEAAAAYRTSLKRKVGHA